MADIKRVSPEEARALLEESGWVYVDVRTEEEFAAGHAPGAFNVPSKLAGPPGMKPNPDFLAVMSSVFPKDTKIVVGCRSGARSLAAAKDLAAGGYRNVVDLRTGWEGSRDAFGRLEPGWCKKGLPEESGQPEGRSYASLVAKRGSRSE
jgi:rhodanese-related sulfurtransferase